MRLNELRSLINEAILNAYEILGVSNNANEDEIKKAYKQKALQFHPDRNKGRDTTSDMVKVNVARDVLLDPLKRRKLDSELQHSPRGSGFGFHSQHARSPKDVWRDWWEAQAEKDKSWNKQTKKDEEEQARRRAAAEADEQERASQRAQKKQREPEQSGWFKKRYFEFINDESIAAKSRKFWWIVTVPFTPNQLGVRITTGWGKIGTPGQQKTKLFPNLTKARAFYAQMIHSKLRKGYKEKTAPDDDVFGHARQRAKKTTSQQSAERPSPGPTKSPRQSKKSTYKIYGRYKGKPVVTRYQGRVYGPSKTSAFKKGDVGEVMLGTDGRLVVKNAKTGETEVWDVVNEDLLRDFFGLALIAEAAGDSDDEVVFGTREELDKRISAMDPDTVSDKDYVDEETGEIYLEKGETANKSSLHPAWHAEQKRSADARRAAEKDWWDAEEEVERKEVEQLDQDFTEALQAFADGWSDYDPSLGDPTDLASDAALSFFHEYPNWKSYAQRHQMSRADVQSMVADYVYEAMVSGDKR